MQESIFAIFLNNESNLVE